MWRPWTSPLDTWFNWYALWGSIQMGDFNVSIFYILSVDFRCVQKSVNFFSNSYYTFIAFISVGSFGPVILYDLTVSFLFLRVIPDTIWDRKSLQKMPMNHSLAVYLSNSSLCVYYLTLALFCSFKYIGCIRNSTTPMYKNITYFISFYFLSRNV